MRLPCFPSHTLIHVKLFHISVSALVVIHTRHIYKPHRHAQFSTPTPTPHYFFFFCQDRDLFIFFFLDLLNCLFLPSRGFPSAEPGFPPFISRTGSSMMLSVTDVCVFVCSGACFYMCFSLIIIIDVVTVFLLIEHFHGDLVCITLSWHQSPPVFVVSVSLPPSLLLRCLIGPSFSVPPFLFLSLSSLHSGTPSSFWVEPQSNAFKLVLLFTLPL